MRLFVFNPEHDYALANGDAHFVAPQSAIQFAHDCATFPCCFAQNNDIVWQPYQSDRPIITVDKEIYLGNLENITEVMPWGWDNALWYRLHSTGLNPAILPNIANVSKIRELSHRKTASEALRYLRQYFGTADALPYPAQLLTNITDIEHFVQSQPSVILKSPYSGNGRGNLPAYSQFTPTLKRQCDGVLHKQGALLGEPQYQVIQDFAMEFSCAGGQTQFEGYSLFKTRHFGYLHNVLISDDAIEQTLSQWINLPDLYQSRKLLVDFIQQKIAPYYNGYLGVDMFVYEENHQYKLHPVVEINLRMTMGMASHIIVERYLGDGASGILQIEYKPAKGEMLQYVTAMAMAFPFHKSNGHWISGFTSLTPIDENTQYAITVQCTNNLQQQ